MGRFFLDNGLITSSATISVDHPALLSGDGVFTTMIVKEGRVEFFDLHMERLKKHARFIHLSFIPISKTLLSTFIKKNHAEIGIWKLKILILPESPYLFNIERKAERVVALLEPIEERKTALSLMYYPEEISGPLSRVKTLSYLERHFLLGEAKRLGFDEVLVGCQGSITEAAFANFFWIEKDTLFYPPKKMPYLFGITLSQIIEAAKNLGLSIQEKQVAIKDLNPKALYFLSNALIGLQLIEKIDSYSFVKNEILENALRKAFDVLRREKAFVVKEAL